MLLLGRFLKKEKNLNFEHKKNKRYVAHELYLKGRNDHTAVFKGLHSAIWAFGAKELLWISCF